MSKKLLKIKMLEYGDTMDTLAEFLGISRQSLCNKINERGTEFRQGEIAKIKERYHLTAEEVEAIFFA